nr:hypothetical protein [Tanacetum cinerariifolium]
MTNKTDKEENITLHYPMLSKSNYAAWAIKMKVFMQAQGVWEAVEPKNTGDAVNVKMDKMDLAAIYQGIPEDMLLSLAEKETTKETWTTLKTMYMGADRVKTTRVQTLKAEFEVLSMKETESVDEFATKLSNVVSNIRALGDKIEETYIVKKLLRAVPSKFLQIALTIEQFGDLHHMSVEEKQSEDDSKSGNKNYSGSSSNSRGRGRGNWSGNRGGRGRGCGNQQRDGYRGSNKNHDKSKMQCYNCQQYGHYAAECRNPRRERNQEANLTQENNDGKPALLLSIFDEDDRVQEVFLNEENVNPRLKSATDVGGDTSLWKAADEGKAVTKSALQNLTRRNKEMVQGLPKITNQNGLCEGCLEGKQARKSFPTHSNFMSTRRIELVHGDLCGPISPPTPARNRYFLLLVDDYTRVMWVYFLKTKDQALSMFKKFRVEVEAETGDRVTLFRTDRGEEFLSKEFSSYCEETRLKRHYTAPYPHQQNGVVERRNRTVIEMARSTMKGIKVPACLWGKLDVLFDEERPWQWGKSEKFKGTPGATLILKGFIPQDDLEDDDMESQTGLEFLAQGTDEHYETNSKYEPVTPISSVGSAGSTSSSTGGGVPKSNKAQVGLQGEKGSTGAVVKHKARLVAKGYVQKAEIDFDEVFTSVARIKTDQPRKVYKLSKALYRLSQAPRAWNSRLDTCLKQIGFKRCQQEYAVYTRNKAGKLLIVGVYVDDLIVTGSCSGEIRYFKEQMNKEFKMSDMGLLSYYLGIEVSQYADRITLKQPAYVKTILKKTGMEDCNACKYPMEPKLELTKDGAGDPIDPTKFRSIVGALRYLTHTRPDISYAVGLVSKFMEKPIAQHLIAVKHILRYVKGTVNYGIVYTKGSGEDIIIGYTDSDFARDVNDRRSTGEFMAATTATCQAIWIKRLLSEITGREIKPPMLFIDNKSTLDLVKNPVFHGRSKHIDTKFHFIRECVEKGEITVQHMCSKEQRADILTKSMAKHQFEDMRSLLGVKELLNYGLRGKLLKGQSIRVTLWGGMGDVLIEMKTHYVGLCPVIISECKTLQQGYKYHPLHVISYPLDQIRTDLFYVEEPEAILDHQDRVMRIKTIFFVKILWRNHPEREATWETEESIRTSYPHFLPL